MFKIGRLKNTTHNIRHEKHTPRIKLIKTGKEIGTTYCIGRKNYTHNFKPQKMTNKVKSQSSKSIFLKLKPNNEK